ncbi:MAG: HAD-IA family hydrolase [Woeseiaceae bacterium]
MNKGNRIVLFDLGGVLADLGEPAQAIGLDITEKRFWEIWLNSENVHAFEMGEMEASEFFPAIATEFGQADNEAFEESLRAWHLPLFPGAEAMIHSVPDECYVALLSNTNAMHWEQVTSETDIFSRFDHLFLSFETGLYKPTAESFEQVIAHFECKPGDVLFLDDSPRNVAGAGKLGFEACQTRGIDEARAIIGERLKGAGYAH